MPVDPKYADLPWIAHGQPDVYEAGELPEADQQDLRDSGDAILPKEIENIKLSVADAHKRFANSRLDASKVDSISGSGKVGYTIDSEEYNILPPDSRDQETLLNRCQRLQTEVQHLLDDVSAVKDQKQSDPKSPIDMVQLTNLAESLKNKIQEVQISDLTGEYSLGQSESIEKSVYNKVLSQISSFQPEKPSTRKPEQSNHLVYEIYDNHTSAKQTEFEKLGDIDRRIQRLEALLGQPDPTRLSALTADVPQHGLLDACSRLAARSALFQSSNLDMIETRLSGLQAKLHAVTEKREAITDFDTQNKIAELYELVKKWTDVVDSLPLIVERLTALKALHEEASQFSQSLNMVETSQKAVEQDMQTYSKLLEEMQTNLSENMNTIKENIASLESKLSKS